MNSIAAYEVKTWNPDREQFYNEYGFINTSSFTETMQWLEDYYGNNLDEIKIHLYSGPFVTSKNLFASIVEELEIREELEETA